jgi:hypothetical protein
MINNGECKNENKKYSCRCHWQRYN